VTLDQAIQELKIRSRTNSMRLPNLREVKEMESFLGITFHPDYVRFLLKASDVDVGFSSQRPSLNPVIILICQQ
jgi:hypothetical protein